MGASRWRWGVSKPCDVELAVSALQPCPRELDVKMKQKPQRNKIKERAQLANLGSGNSGVSMSSAGQGR